MEVLVLRRYKKGLLTTIALLMFIITSSVASAAAVPNTDLFYDGGQTGTHVYSNIYDTNTKNNKKWKVNAIVKVCNSKKQSGFLNDSASVRDNRSFWCNETSSYDYYARP